LTVNALTAADSVLIPLQCEYYALEGLRSLLETIELIRERLNPDLAIEGLLLTMFDPRNKLCHQVADEIRQFFPEQVFDSIIPRNVRLSESPSHGLPVILYDPSCRGAQSYVELAKEITKSDKSTRSASR
jgi:chromosome partitioning protein